MAQVVENDKGFKVIKTTRVEIVSIGGYGICDDCNTPALNGYYIAVLNVWVCGFCYNDWLARAKRHNEDIKIELRNFEFYCSKLNINSLLK